jgi:hypothetical protein
VERHCNAGKHDAYVFHANASLQILPVGKGVTEAPIVISNDKSRAYARRGRLRTG